MTDEEVDRTLVISYHHNEKGDGVLLNGTIPVTVDKIVEEDEIDKRSRLISYNIRHPTFLRCMGRSSDGDVVYEEYTETLRAFVERKNPPLVEEFKVPALNCKTENRLTYHCIPDTYRRMIRAAIKFLIYLHDEMDMSLSELKLDRNFVVRGSSLKIGRLRYNEFASREPTTKEEMEKLELRKRELKNKDFNHLAAVLRQVFDGKTVPHDFENLLSCMDSYEEMNGDKVLLVNHLAVLRSGKRLAMIKKLREKAYYLGSGQRQVYDGLYGTMGDWNRYFEDWTLKLNGSRPEYGAFKILFESKNSSYWFNRYSRETTLRSLNVNAIKFCRDIAVHINTEGGMAEVLF